MPRRVFYSLFRPQIFSRYGRTSSEWSGGFSDTNASHRSHIYNIFGPVLQYNMIQTPRQFVLTQRLKTAESCTSATVQHLISWTEAFPDYTRDHPRGPGSRVESVACKLPDLPFRVAALLIWGLVWYLRVRGTLREEG